MLRSFKQFFSGPIASTICFVVALFSRMMLLRIFFDFGSDKLGQVLIARNFLGGKALTIGQVSAENLAHQIYAPAIYNPPIGWPPGYSILLSPLLLITSNIALACLLLDFIAALIFLIYLRKLLQLLKFDSANVNLFLLFQGFIIYNSGPSDFLGLTFLVMAMFYLVKSYQSTQFSPALVLMLSVSFIGAAMLRYLYQPVSFLILFFSIIHALANGKRRVAVRSFIPLLLLSTASLFWFAYQKGYHLHGVYMAPSATGFFPKNLLLMNPFVLASLFNIHFYTVQLSKLFHQSYGSIAGIFQWTNFLLVVALTLIYFRFAQKSWRRLKAEHIFLLIGGFACIAIVGGLCFLSILHSREVGPPLFRWTYVTPGRYYLFPMLFLQIFVWNWLFVRAHATNTVLLRIAQAFFALLVCIEILHGSYLIVKKFSSPLVAISKTAEASAEDKALADYLERYDFNRSKLVVSAFTKRFIFYAQLKGAFGFYNPLDLYPDKLRSGERTALLLIVTKSEEQFVSAFLKQPGVRIVTTAGEYNFYEYEIDGH